MLIDVNADGFPDDLRSTTLQESMFTAEGTPVSVTRCAVAWRRGLAGGGFQATPDVMVLPTAVLDRDRQPTIAPTHDHAGAVAPATSDEALQ
jgi:hypothetical protein